jgi:hypothetical protein
MKKLLPFILLLAFAGSVSGQLNVVFYEDFSNGMPADFTLVDVDGKTPATNINWFPANTAWAVINTSFSTEAALSISWYNPVGASDDWMITPAIDIPALSSMENKFLLSWYARAQDAQYPDGYEVYVSTTGNQPANFTQKIFSTVGENSSGITRSADLSSFENQTIYLAFRNNSNDKFILIIDDIAVAETAPYDVAGIRSTNKGYNAEGNLNLATEIINIGSATINSLTMNYAIDGGDTIIANVTGLNIAPLAIANVTHPSAWNSITGLHDAEIWVSHINGNDDASPINNPVFTSMSIYGANDVSQRRVMVEGFSSSTCPPCAPANITFSNLINSIAPADRPVVLKLQQPFPGVGDPYSTAEMTERCLDYYEVAGIPDSRVDGDFWSGLTGNVTNTILNQAKARAGLASFDLEYSVDSITQTVHITGSITPSANLLPDTRLMLAIKESTTVKNKKDNTESLFKDVVKKLINGQEGIEIGGLTAGTPYPVDISYQFNGNYRLPVDGQLANQINHATEHSVEFFSNLKVSAWVEYQRDRFVLNAADAEEMTSGTQQPNGLTNFTIYPNPAVNNITLDLNLVEALDCQVQLFDAEGKMVQSIFNGTMASGNTTIPVRLNELPTGTYFMHLRSASGLSVQTVNVVR